MFSGSKFIHNSATGIARGYAAVVHSASLHKIMKNKCFFCFSTVPQGLSQ